MLNDENIISKSRSIIDLRNVNLTIQEFRLMEVYLSKINPQDETTASVTFTKQGVLIINTSRGAGIDSFELTIIIMSSRIETY